MSIINLSIISILNTASIGYPNHGVINNPIIPIMNITNTIGDHTNKNNKNANIVIPINSRIRNVLFIFAFSYI